MRKGFLLLTVGFFAFVPSLSSDETAALFPDNAEVAPSPTTVELRATRPAALDERLPSDSAPSPAPTTVAAAERVVTPSDLPATRSDKRSPAGAADLGVHLADTSWLEEGRFIALQRKSPQALFSGDKMKFVATLVNSTQARWNLVAEVLVNKSDGSQETLISHYKLHLNKGKQLRVPMAMSAKPSRFPPGLTQFVAFLRDPSGQIIDRASISFVVRLPLP